MNFDTKQFALYLFDFDGLLADTERIHHAAYRAAAAAHDVDLNWSFAEYCLKAHFSEAGLADAIFEAFPNLKVRHCLTAFAVEVLNLFWSAARMGKVLRREKG